MVQSQEIHAQVKRPPADVALYAAEACGRLELRKGRTPVDPQAQLPPL